MKKRISFLPEIGQSILKAMAAEGYAKTSKGSREPSYCTSELYNLANIPADFEARWNAERAIQDCMLKAREYGLVVKQCGGKWRYCGPEVKKGETEYKREEAKKLKAASVWLKKTGVKIYNIQVQTYGSNKGRITARVVLPERFSK